MDLFTYISMNSPDAVNGVLSAYGYERGGSVTEVENILKQFVREKRKVALMEIADIHPDRDLIEESLVNNSPTLNFDGRSRGAFERMKQDLRTDTYFRKDAPHRPIEPNFWNNANGEAPVVVKEDLKEEGIKVNLKHLIMLGGFLFVGYAIMKSK